MITIELEEENVAMAGITVPFQYINEIQKLLDKDCLFNKVDPYADTSFDRDQCNTILNELQPLQSSGSFAPEAKRTLLELIDFCKLCVTYMPGNRVLVFYGD